MPNGSRGDHPLTDILDHQMSVFSPVIDDLIRRLAKVSSRERLEKMFDWFHVPDRPDFERQLRAQVETLEREGRERGWEI